MSIEYDIYLNEHIENVQRGLAWMRDNLKVNGLIDEEAMPIAFDHSLFHDSSKTSSEEYPAYDAYFYGGNRSYKVCQDFDYAWLHHQKLNPHHWQYWILIKDEPDDKDEDPFDTELHKPGPTLKPLLIPLEYIYEMIADWWTFSWKSGNLFEIFAWYNTNSPYMLMHEASKAVVNGILKEMYNVLIATELEQNHDISEIEKKYSLYFMKKDAQLKHSDISTEVPYTYLKHYGLKGMKWGERRWQNYDGTFNEAGKERYFKDGTGENYKKLKPEQRLFDKKAFHLDDTPYKMPEKIKDKKDILNNVSDWEKKLYDQLLKDKSDIDFNKMSAWYDYDTSDGCEWNIEEREVEIPLS